MTPLRLTYQGHEIVADAAGPHAIIEVAAVQRINDALTLAKRALEHECCCGGVGCRWTEDEAKPALAALNELLPPPAKEETK